MAVVDIVVVVDVVFDVVVVGGILALFDNIAFVECLTCGFCWRRICCC